MWKIVIVSAIFIIVIIYAVSVRQLETLYTTDSLIIPSAKISCNGKYIAFVQSSPNDMPKLMIMDLDSKKYSVINDDAITGSFAWSNEPDIIIYAARTINFQYCVIMRNVVTGTATTITKYFDKMLVLSDELINIRDFCVLDYLDTFHEVKGKKWHDSILWHLNTEGKYDEIAKGMIAPTYYSDNNKICYAKGDIIDNKLIWNIYIKDIISGKPDLILDNVTDYRIKCGYLYHFRTESTLTFIGKMSLKDMSKIVIGTFNRISLPVLSDDCSNLVYYHDKQIRIIDLKDLKEKKVTNTKEVPLQLLWEEKNKTILYITPHSIKSVNISQTP